MYGLERAPPIRNGKQPSKQHWYITVSISIQCPYKPLSQDFIQTKGYPSWTIVTSVLEGAEHFTFKQNFSDWVNKEEVPAPVVAKPRNSIGSSKCVM